MNFLAFVVLSQLTFAEPREAHPSSGCDQGAVQACVAGERAAELSASAAAAALDEPIRQAAAELERQREARGEAGGKLARNQALRAALSSEISFSKTPAPSPAAEIFSGFPSVEDFFQLHPLEKQWLGKYPSERAQKLEERRRVLETDAIGLKADYDDKSSKFGVLNAQYTSLLDRRSHLVTEVSQHEHMCGGGCHEALCPPREP